MKHFSHFSLIIYFTKNLQKFLRPLEHWKSGKVFWKFSSSLTSVSAVCVTPFKHSGNTKGSQQNTMFKCVKDRENFSFSAASLCNQVNAWLSSSWHVRYAGETKAEEVKVRARLCQSVFPQLLKWCQRFPFDCAMRVAQLFTEAALKFRAVHHLTPTLLCYRSKVTLV